MHAVAAPWHDYGCVGSKRDERRLASLPELAGTLGARAVQNTVATGVSPPPGSSAHPRGSKLLAAGSLALMWFTRASLGEKPRGARTRKTVAMCEIADSAACADGASGPVWLWCENPQKRNQCATCLCRLYPFPHEGLRDVGPGSSGTVCPKASRLRSHLRRCQQGPARV